MNDFLRISEDFWSGVLTLWVSGGFWVKTDLPQDSIPSITIQFNVKNKQEIQISAKHGLQNAVAMATSDPLTKILPITKLLDKFEEKSYEGLS